MIGVIADDLTGAAEIGAVGLRHGLRAEVLLSGDPSGSADLVCIDTDSRSCRPEEAGRRSAAAANLLTSREADWIYKKVDSVLRGQITAEIQAILRELGISRALLIPANPSLGRTIKNGNYFIQSKPIHETEFARDPEYPRTSSRVHDLLAATETSTVAVCATEDALPSHGIVVGQVESVNDLRTWASRQSNAMLVAGGAEFFAALLAAAGHKPGRVAPVATKPALVNEREVFVCGSTSESSREFIRSARESGTQVFSLPQAARHREFDLSLLEPFLCRGWRHGKRAGSPPGLEAPCHSRGGRPWHRHPRRRRRSQAAPHDQARFLPLARKYPAAESSAYLSEHDEKHPFGE